MLKYIKIAFEIIGQIISKIWIWFLLAVIVYVILFSGMDIYRDIYREDSLKIEEETDYEEQNTLFLAIRRPDTLNPINSKSEDIYYISKLIYSSLFEYDENLSLKPVLVKSYSVNTEKAHIDCSLKTGIKFSDKSGLDAYDVEHTVNLIKSSPEGSPYYDVGRRIAGFRRTGSYSFRIYFNNNYNCSLGDLVFPILSSKQGASQRRPAGTGRYRIKSYDFNKEIRLVPNKKYFAEAASKNMVFRIIPKDAEIYNLMQMGEISCNIETGNDRKSEALDKNFVIYDFPSDKTDFVYLNNRNPHLKSKRFRQAVNYCIEKKEILEKAYMGDGILTDCIYYPDYLGATDELDNYGFNVKTASEMLKKAGYEDSDNDGFFDGVELKILVNDDNPMRASAASKIKSGLRQAGIKAKLLKKPKKAYIKLIKAGKFDILVTGYAMNEKYDLRSFFNGKAEWGFRNYNLSAAASELSRLHKADEYKAYYEKLRDAVIEDASYSVLCYRKNSIIGVETFTAEELPVFNDIYKNSDTWSWKKRL